MSSKPDSKTDSKHNLDRTYMLFQVKYEANPVSRVFDAAEIIRAGF